MKRGCLELFGIFFPTCSFRCRKQFLKKCHLRVLQWRPCARVCTAHIWATCTSRGSGKQHVPVVQKQWLPNIKKAEWNWCLYMGLYMFILFYTTGFSHSIGISMDFSILNQSGWRFHTSWSSAEDSSRCETFLGCVESWRLRGLCSLQRETQFEDVQTIVKLRRLQFTHCFFWSVYLFIHCFFSTFGCTYHDSALMTLQQLPRS